MTYTAISVIGMEIYAAADRIVCQWRLQCCRMEITIYRRLMKLFLRIWQHHHLMIVSTIVSIIHEQVRGILGMEMYGKANLRLDASLLQ